MTSSASQSHVHSSFYSCLLLGNSWGLWLQSGPGALTYNIYLTAERMGNQISRNASPITQELVDQLGQLVRLQYSAPCRLGFNPFDLEPARVQPPNVADFAISSMVEEGDETQPLSSPNAAVGHPIAQMDSPSRTYTQLRPLQKNQSQSKLKKKAKKISKAPKPKSRNPWAAQSREDGDCNSNETVAADDLMRDQNNCKSYHKLVKNYLIQRGLGEEIDKYETKYHTRYYFIVALIMIKHHLKEDFTDIYQKIVEKELAVQQRKIDRKLTQLHLTRERLTTLHSRNQPTQSLRIKQANLQSQIQHIKVVKFQIENYSMRSCRAFFQGEIEESLKILYLKNDPVMRKKYYFDQALMTVQELQSQMRKSHSHR